jgi:hypothetical protein
MQKIAAPASGWLAMTLLSLCTLCSPSIALRTASVANVKKQSQCKSVQRAADSVLRKRNMKNKANYGIHDMDRHRVAKAQRHKVMSGMAQATASPFGPRNGLNRSSPLCL